MPRTSLFSNKQGHLKDFKSVGVAEPVSSYQDGLTTAKKQKDAKRVEEIERNGNAVPKAPPGGYNPSQAA